jgi:hypothetical protein
MNQIKKTLHHQICLLFIKNDFNYMMNGEEVIDKVSCSVVDLMPKDKSKTIF